MQFILTTHSSRLHRPLTLLTMSLLSLLSLLTLLLPILPLRGPWRRPPTRPKTAPMPTIPIPILARGWYCLIRPLRTPLSLPASYE